MIMITEDYTSFEIAKLLREKGFNEDSWFHYDANGDVVTRGYRLNRPDDIPAWTHQMAMKWLREVHNIHIYTFYANGWTFAILNLGTREEFTKQKGYSNEEAVEAALKYCLTNLI